MERIEPARRLCGLPRAEVLGVEVPVAGRYLSRLLGLALLPRERAGSGLLIPRCNSVHTFGMRFPLSIAFLDSGGAVIRSEDDVGPGRMLAERGAAAVVELCPGAMPLRSPPG